jgi:hypothetical protein
MFTTTTFTSVQNVTNNHVFILLFNVLCKNKSVANSSNLKMNRKLHTAGLFTCKAKCVTNSTQKSKTITNHLFKMFYICTHAHTHTLNEHTTIKALPIRKIVGIILFEMKTLLPLI